MSKNNQNYGTLQIGSINYPLQKTTYSSILAISQEINRIPVAIAKSNDDVVSSVFRNALMYREASSVIAVGMTKTRLIFESHLTHWIFQHIVRRKARMLNGRHSSIELNAAGLGWGDAANDRSAQARGIATASQESVDELNGRMTAVQGHTFIISENSNIIRDNTNAILGSVQRIEYNTEELHSLRRDLHGLKDTIEIQGVRLRS